MKDHRGRAKGKGANMKGLQQSKGRTPRTPKRNNEWICNTKENQKHKNQTPVIFGDC